MFRLCVNDASKLARLRYLRMPIYRSLTIHVSNQIKQRIENLVKKYKYWITTAALVGTGMSLLIIKKSIEFVSPFASTRKSVTADLQTTTTIQDLSDLEDQYNAETSPPLSSPHLVLFYWIGKTYDFIRLTLRVIRLSVLFSPVIVFFVFQYYFAPSLYNKWCKFLVWSIQRAGPCFIKLSQWAGTRLDLFGETLCSHLSTMHTQAPAHSFSHTRHIIKHEFGRSIEELFDHFSEIPIASGAIAQVYLAKLKTQNAHVAVKVRHPKVVKVIVRDLTILQFFTKIVSYLPQLQWLNLVDNIRVFSKSMQAQTNLKVEAENLKLFSANFAAFNSIRFPIPFLEYTTSQVLVESYEDGTPLEDYIQDINHEKYSPKLKKRIAQLGINTYLKMMLVDNFVHADLHPGNLMVRMQKKYNKFEPQLIVMDAGLVTKLSERDRVNFIDLFSAVASGNGELAAQLMIERARNANEIRPDPVLVEGFKRDMSQLIGQVLVTPLSQLEVGQILEQVLTMGRKYHVPVESNFTTLVLGTIIVEGIGKQLNPDLNFVDAAKPFLVKDAAMRDAYIRGRLSHKTDWWRVWKWI
jgi:aarF domain-containing kinase